VRAYLVRHGEAESEQVAPQRHLTEGGAAEARRIATEAADELGVRPRGVLHSGKARARQTAEIWAAIVGSDVSEADGLAPNDDPSIWHGRLGAEADDVMLVGHLPHLERLVGLLVTGDAERTVARFPAGGLVVVDDDGHEWRVAASRP